MSPRYQTLVLCGFNLHVLNESFLLHKWLIWPIKLNRLGYRGYIQALLAAACSLILTKLVIYRRVYSSTHQNILKHTLVFEFTLFKFFFVAGTEAFMKIVELMKHKRFQHLFSPPLFCSKMIWSTVLKSQLHFSIMLMLAKPSSPHFCNRKVCWIKQEAKNRLRLLLKFPANIVLWEFDGIDWSVFVPRIWRNLLEFWLRVKARHLPVGFAVSGIFKESNGKISKWQM